MAHMKRLILPIVMILGACGPSRPSVPAPLYPKMVTRVIELADEWRWRRSGYWRLAEDPVTIPYRIIEAGDNTGCVVFEFELVVPRERDMYVCQIPWRIKRVLP